MLSVRAKKPNSHFRSRDRRSLETSEPEQLSERRLGPAHVALVPGRLCLLQRCSRLLQSAQEQHCKLRRFARRARENFRTTAEGFLRTLDIRNRSSAL